MRISDWSSDVCSSDLQRSAECVMQRLFGAIEVAEQADQGCKDDARFGPVQRIQAFANVMRVEVAHRGARARLLIMGGAIVTARTQSDAVVQHRVTGNALCYRTSQVRVRLRGTSASAVT